MRAEKMTTGSSSQVDMNHWFYRLIALIIDSIIVAIPAWIILSVITWILVFNVSLWWLFFGWGYYLILFLLVGVLSLLYYIVLEVSWGATVGKRVLGLQVQTVDGKRVTFNQSFVRNISKIFWVFLLLDWIIGIATPGRDPHQKYTDRMAGTTVVSVRQAFASSSPPPPPPPPPS